MPNKPGAGPLEAFLARCAPLFTGCTRWADGGIQLRLAGYLAAEVPPLQFVTSVRCMVFADDAVLVVRDPVGPHILPGGRREGAESLEQTLRREVLEETGWAIDAPELLGCVHFHHVTARPAEYAYPYPDFLNIVYVANAVTCVPESMVDDGYELEAVFRLVAEVRSIALPVGQQLFLDEALRRGYGHTSTNHELMERPRADGALGLRRRSPGR